MIQMRFKSSLKTMTKTHLFKNMLNLVTGCLAAECLIWNQEMQSILRHFSITWNIQMNFLAIYFWWPIVLRKMTILVPSRPQVNCYVFVKQVMSFKQRLIRILFLLHMTVMRRNIFTRALLGKCWHVFTSKGEKRMLAVVWWVLMPQWFLVRLILKSILTLI